MRQNDVHFINILNRFQTGSQIIDDIHFMNNFCLRPPPIDNTLLHLFLQTLKPQPITKLSMRKHPYI